MPLKLDVSDSFDEKNIKLRENYDAKELPTVVFVTTDGIELGRFKEKVGPDEFLESLRPAIDRLREKIGSR